MMVHGDEARDEDTTDILDILERERCLGELSVGYLAVYHLVNGCSDRLFGKVRQAARTRLDGICHHEDRSFFGRGFSARITEEGLVDRLLRVRVTIGVVEIANQRRAVMGRDEVDDHFGQVVAAGDLLAFGDMGYDHLCGIARIHIQERVLRACLVFHEIERVGHLTDIMVEGAGTYQQGIGTDGFGGFGCEVRDLHGMLEGTRSTFSQRVQQLRVDIRQFDQRDRRDETEELLEAVDQAVTTDREQAADEEIEVHPRIDGREDACLRKGEGRVGNALREVDPCGCLHQLGAARHVREGRYRNHADYDLNEEELHRRRHDDRCDEDGRKMQKQRCA